MFNNGLPNSSLFCCISLLCLPHCLSTHITCVVCSSAFYAMCAMSIHLHSSSSVLFSCCTLILLHTWITFTNNNHSKLQQQQQPHLFSVPCIYSFCASCACNIFHSYACSYCTNLLHLLSSLRDHHRNSSASLAIFPRVQHHWMLCWDSSASLAVETLRLLCDSRADLLCFSYRLPHSSICQSLLRIVLLHLDEAWRFFISSGDHTGVSSNSLADTINGFW